MDQVRQNLTTLILDRNDDTNRIIPRRHLKMDTRHLNFRLEKSTKLCINFRYVILTNP